MLSAVPEPDAARGATRAETIAEWIGRVGLLGALAVQAFKRLADPDLPWHLALGRYIASQRKIPSIDPLAFTHRPVQYIEFLSDLGFYGLMRVGGPLLLQLFGAVLLALLALLLLARCRGAGPIALVVVALALAAIGDWILVRPATLSFVLLAFTLWVLDAHRREPDRKRTRVWLMLLVPLFGLWVNLHGFAVLGLVLLVFHAGYRGACRLTRGRLPRLFPKQDGGDAGRTLIVATLCVAASGANVAGYQLLTAPLRVGGDFSRIGEWQRTSLEFLARHELGMLAFGVVVALALAFGREPNESRVPPAYELGLLAVAVFLGLSALRMLPVAVIIAAPIVARRLAALAPVTPSLHWLSGLSLTVVGPILLVQNPTSFGRGFEPAHFPEAAVSFIEREHPAGRMWNYLDFGGYLSWRLYPEHLVMIDGRSSWVHAPALVDQFHASLRDDAAFESLVSEYTLEWAIVRAKPNEPFGAPIAKSPAWTLVYLDGMSAVYVRKAGPNAALAARGYRLLRHLTAPQMALDAALRGQLAPSDLDHDAQLAIEQSPDDPRAWFFEAAAAISTGDTARLGRARAQLTRLVPGHPLIAVFDAAAAGVRAGSSR